MTAVPFTDGREREDIASIVRGIIARTAGRESVSDDQHLWNDLFITVETRNEILMAIEARLDIEFAGTEFTSQRQTVGALVAMVEELTQEK